MFEGPRAVARDVVTRWRRELLALSASFDDEILLCECASGGGVTCDGAAAPRASTGCVSSC